MPVLMSALLDLPEFVLLQIVDNLLKSCKATNELEIQVLN